MSIPKELATFMEEGARFMERKAILKTLKRRALRWRERAEPMKDARMAEFYRSWAQGLEEAIRAIEARGRRKKKL